MGHYIIIGGGPSSSNAAESIRKFDSSGKITIICNEPLHSRMALPYWLAGQIPEQQTLTADTRYFSELQIDARIGVRATGIDANAKQVWLEDGNSLRFDKLLIATGSSPIKLSVTGSDLPGVQSLWTLRDTEQALANTRSLATPRAVMIGSGFIGFIMLNAMYKRGWKLAVVEREAHILPRLLNQQAAALVSHWLRAKGVDLYPQVTVSAIHQHGNAKRLTLSDGRTIEADLVVVATGVKPTIDFLADSGIAIDQGVLVDEYLCTNFPDIYAAGDIAQGPVLYGRERAIHAIQPTAVDHGRIAGANMAGQRIAYPGSLAMNVLDVCGLQCAGFGDWLNPNAETMTIANVKDIIYRNWMWDGADLTGALFVGRANDLGMLSDIGMAKGILQTQTALGPWKDYLRDNPFDIRRPYVACKVAAKLRETMLLGQAATARQYRYQNRQAAPALGDAHACYVNPLGQ